MTRWLPRFRLRTLLVLTAVCGLLLAPAAVEFSRYRREQAAIERLYWFSASRCLLIEQEGAWYGIAPSVTKIRMVGDVAAADFQIMADLPGLNYVEVHDATLNDADLEAVSRLQRLEFLDLFACKFPENGLRSLVPLRKLKVLQIYGSYVPESAIVELQEALPGLEVLHD